MKNKGRCAAIKLLSHIGTSILYQSEYIETVYRLLETRLADDPIGECRLQVGRTIKDLKFFEKILNKAIMYVFILKFSFLVNYILLLFKCSNLENFDEDIRMKAVLSIVIFNFI